MSNIWNTFKDTDALSLACCQMTKAVILREIIAKELQRFVFGDFFCMAKALRFLSKHFQEGR